MLSLELTHHHAKVSFIRIVIVGVNVLNGILLFRAILTASVITFLLTTDAYLHQHTPEKD